MSKYHNKLIDLMKLKASVIPNASLKERYFLKEDEQNILKWEDSMAEYVYRDIQEAFLTGEINDSFSCPFCIKAFTDNTYRFMNKCNLCEYGKIHYPCSDSRSIYYQVIAEELYFAELLDNEEADAELSQIFKDN